MSESVSSDDDDDVMMSSLFWVDDARRGEVVVRRVMAEATADRGKDSTVVRCSLRQRRARRRDGHNILLSRDRAQRVDQVG